MSDKSIIVFKPNQRHEEGFIKTWIIMSKNIFKSRELIWQLFRRDFLAAYKKSFFGMAWIFISPLMGIVSWVFLNATGMLNPGDVGIPYPAYVLIGTSMWGLFIGFFESAEATLSSGKDLVLQVYYPREALLFKQTAQHLANFSISLMMILIFLFIFGVTPTWKILLLPLVAFPLFLLGASIGLVTSMISVVAMDIGKIIKMGMSLMMYITPIIYSSDVNNPLVRMIVKWNPLTYLVCSCRDIIIFGRLYDLEGYSICSLASLLLFLISWRLFYVSEDRVIERMI
ncbi:MAG: ABC transporter permease [Desulfobacteraceae bacterium]|nr:ABC transporter permease [Desulfobacteraceae bacterium]MBU4037280.1 ABC transporter permease [Pseudomonadota bacterium]